MFWVFLSLSQICPGGSGNSFLALLTLGIKTCSRLGDGLNLGSSPKPVCVFQCSRLDVPPCPMKMDLGKACSDHRPISPIQAEGTAAG